MPDRAIDAPPLIERDSVTLTDIARDLVQRAKWSQSQGTDLAEQVEQGRNLAEAAGNHLRAAMEEAFEIAGQLMEMMGADASAVQQGKGDLRRLVEGAANALSGEGGAVFAGRREQLAFSIENLTLSVEQGGKRVELSFSRVLLLRLRDLHRRRLGRRAGRRHRRPLRVRTRGRQHGRRVRSPLRHPGLREPAGRPTLPRRFSNSLHRRPSALPASA